jgi:hypothetical protein
MMVLTKADDSDLSLAERKGSLKAVWTVAMKVDLLEANLVDSWVSKKAAMMEMRMADPMELTRADATAMMMAESSAVMTAALKEQQMADSTVPWKVERTAGW